MNMNWLDWLILAGLLAGLVTVLQRCRKFVRSSADFLAAGRLGGRYLLSISAGMSGVGAVTIIAAFEMNYTAGFSPVWWGFVTGIIGIVSALSGWVLYRFRETRALTLPQFLEMRYSRKFRIFAGILAWISGVANYGIFPAVSVRFFIYFCEIPTQWDLGFATIPVFPLLVLIVLSLGVWFATSGGQIAIMVTDFIQGIFCNVVFLVLLLFLFCVFNKEMLVSTLVSLSESGSGKSLVDPFQSNAIRDFNPWFFIINTIAAFYSVGAWLGSQGFQVAAKSPHEQKMAGLLGTWRAIAQNLLFLFIPICAVVVMNHVEFVPLADQVRETLSTIENPQLRDQLVVPVVLLKLLPAGMIGLFAAVMFAAMLSTDNTYMHSWGSIMVQDIIMPLRGKPFRPETHMKLLKLSIVFVGVVAFFISNLYRQTQYIYLYCNITGAIFMGGAGSVIIGGLYWKKGSTLGAWCALTTGSLLAVGNIVLCSWLPEWFRNAEGRPLINEQWGFGISIAGAIGIYIIASLLEKSLKHEPDFNLDKMLHRGRYADSQSAKPATGLRALGFTDEFTRGDKFIFFAGIGWTILWFLVGVTLLVPEYTGVMTTTGWAEFWFWYVIAGAIIGAITTVIFFIGGIKDMIQLYCDLRAARRDNRDDGWVDDHS